jgi:hypothetical protein
VRHGGAEALEAQCRRSYDSETKPSLNHVVFVSTAYIWYDSKNEKWEHNDQGQEIFTSHA